MTRILPPGAAALLILALAGCGGGGASLESKSDVRTTTTGQELLDLKAALDAGAISQDEYDEQRERILDDDG